MESNKERLFALLCMFVSVHLCSCVSVSCNVGQPVETRPYAIICTGISAALRVEWRRSFQMGVGDGVIASCNDVNICTVSDPKLYSVSRTTGNTSSLTILSVTRDDGTQGMWTCSSGGQSPSCTLPPVVYLPELSAPCTAELTLDGPVARCRIQKVYPLPECTWLESVTPSGGTGETSSNSTISSSSAEARTESVTSFYENSRLYFSATCVLKRNVTNIEGNFSYTAVISPGSVRHGVQIVGPSSVVAPSPPTLRNCSHGYIPPAQEVLCTCEVRDLGWPRGHVMWMDQWGRVIRPGQNSSVQLLRRDVLETSVNRTFTCQSRSTDNFVRAIDYVPLFAFGPIGVRMTGPNSFDGKDTSRMTLTCTAFGVNPRPTFTWQGQGQDSQTSAGDGRDEPMIYSESIAFVPPRNVTSLEVTCHVRNSQFNGSFVYNTSFTISCDKNCFPHDRGGSSGAPSDDPESSLLGVRIEVWVLGAGCAVLLIFVVVLTVVVTRCCACCRRQKKKEIPSPPDRHEVDINTPTEVAGRNGTQPDVGLSTTRDRALDELRRNPSCPTSRPPPPPPRHPHSDTLQHELSNLDRDGYTKATGIRPQLGSDQTVTPQSDTTTETAATDEQAPSSASNTEKQNPSLRQLGVTPASQFNDSSLGSDSSSHQTLPKQP